MPNPHEKTGRVTAAYQMSDPDPLVLTAGQVVTVGQRDTHWPRFVRCTDQSGKSGWVPESYLDREGSHGVARVDYKAIELTVTTGETLTLHYEESEWAWCTNRLGESGWVPLENIEIL